IKGIIYIGTLVGGIYKSLDGGENWEEINKGLTGNIIMDININNKNSGTIYLATREYPYKSINSGKSWKRLATDVYPPEVRMFSPVIRVDPEDTNIVYLGVYDGWEDIPVGVLISKDAGETWEFSNEGRGDSVGVWDIDVVVNNNKRIMAVAAEDYGVYWSYDGGKSWERKSSGLDGDYIFDVLIHPDYPEIAFAGGVLFLHRTIDGGISWQKLTRGLPGGEVRHFNDLYLNPHNSQEIYVSWMRWEQGDLNKPHIYISVSRNLGDSWSAFYVINGNYKPSFAIDPTEKYRFYVGVPDHIGLAGVMMSEDGGLTWNELNNGWEKPPVTLLTIDPQDPRKLYAGTYYGFWQYTNTELGIERESTEKHPEVFQLFQNYPNPFNIKTTIKYFIPANAPVNLSIYNIKGELIVTLVDGIKEKGEHSVIWNGEDNYGKEVSSGLYFYAIRTESIESDRVYNSVRKMVFLK
ncbi:MAG: FlgD immunoglobulin-like domain containing protein, partial [Fidelibacterota bacterium]